MVQRNKTDFRDRVMKEKATVQIRHDRDGKPVIEHPACNATLARIRAAAQSPAIKSGPPHMTTLEQPTSPNQDQDALIDQLHRYPLAHSAFTQQDINRLRALADSTLFSTHLLDWSFYLYNLSDRIESITPNP